MIPGCAAIPIWGQPRGGDAFDQFVSAIATTPSGDVVIAGKLLSQLDLGSGPVSDLGGGFAMFLASLSP